MDEETTLKARKAVIEDEINALSKQLEYLHTQHSGILNKLFEIAKQRGNLNE